MTIRRNLNGISLAFVGRPFLAIDVITLQLPEKLAVQVPTVSAGSSVVTSYPAGLIDSGMLSAEISYDPTKIIPRGAADELIRVTLATWEYLDIVGHVTKRSDPKATADGRAVVTIEIKINNDPRWQKSQVADPIISLADAVATVTCADTYATIFYTTDGTVPTSASAIYRDSVTLTGGQTIKAIAIRYGFVDSGVVLASAPTDIPVITSALSVESAVNVAFSYTITATNSPTSYGATGLPSGLSVNTSTGVISGTPTSSGTTSVTISATNASGTGTATLSINITTGIGLAIASQTGGLKDAAGTWTTATLPSAGVVATWQRGSGTRNCYVAHGSGLIYSSDLSAWTSKTRTFTNLRKVVYDLSRSRVWVGLLNGGFDYTDDNGVTWANKAVPSGLSFLNQFDCDDSGNLVCFASTGVIKRSTDGGTSWSTVWTGTASMQEIFYDPIGLWMATYISSGNNLIVLTSSDGITWTTGGTVRAMGGSSIASARGMVYFQSAWYVANYNESSDCQIHKSTDGGANWSSVLSVGSVGRLGKISANGSEIVAVWCTSSTPAQPKIYKSSDGSSWSSQAFGSAATGTIGCAAMDRG